MADVGKCHVPSALTNCCPTRCGRISTSTWGEFPRIQRRYADAYL
jgi:hypothetical protein